MKGDIFLSFLRSLRLILVIHTIYNTVQDSREQTLYLPVYQYICIHHWQNHEVFILKKKCLFTFLCFIFPACWWTPFTPSHLIITVIRYRSYFNTICSIWFKLWSLNWYRILVWIGMKSLRKGRRKKQTNHCRCFFLLQNVFKYDHMEQILLWCLCFEMFEVKVHSQGWGRRTCGLHTHFSK